jgi:hypothetical protein
MFLLRTDLVSICFIRFIVSFNSLPTKKAAGFKSPAASKSDKQPISSGAYVPP